MRKSQKHFFEGKTVNNFTVGKLEKGFYQCTCFCGKIKYIPGYTLDKGNYKSCGCIRDVKTKQYEDAFREKFWSQVNKIQDGCWNWTGLSRGGYGRINYRKKTQGCTRVIWQWYFGEIPKDLFLLHKCDNPLCVNPDHLFLGTKLENMRDCVKKGRKKGNLGEKNHQSKLKEEQVVEIKKLLREGLSRPKIAKIFGVGITTIGHIKQGHNWKHVQ